MMKQKIGQVTEEEKKEILYLFERKNGLAELSKIVKSDDALYDKMVMDMGATSTKFQAWWDKTAEKYQWETKEGGNWEINFETNEIYLVYADF
jgi:CXXX repeat modification system protein